jgi:hypothetical protein
MSLVIAIIGDIVKSKEIVARGLVQQRLKTILKKTGAKNSSIISPYTITLGDEFQALYKNPSGLLRNLFVILSDLAPIKLRFGIGIANLSTRINHKTALGMDGPAFHKARSAIEEAKHKDAIFFLDVDKNHPTCKLVNQIFKLLSHDLQRWPESRYKIFSGLLKGKSAKDLASEIGITYQAVYKHISASNLNDMLDLIDLLEDQIRSEFM